MLSKVVNAIISLFLISALAHYLSLNLPGDPFSLEQPLRMEAKLALREYYGLDHPWHVQYGRYLLNLFKGDLGISLVYKGLTVNQLIGKAFPISALLGLIALFISSCFGIAIGLIAAFCKNKWQDRSIFFFSTLILSTPSFILATLFQFVFAVKLGLFPIAKLNGIISFILPALSLSLVPLAFIARQVKENALKIMNQDFILLAKVKKLSKKRILFVHMLPNILVPLFGYFGQLAVNILTGSFLVERIFAIPGLGFWFVSSILERDYPVIFGLTVFYSALLIGFSLIFELAATLIDPRVREKKYA